MEKDEPKDEQPAVDTFDLSTLKPTEHEYIQRGSELVCIKPGHRHRQRIDPTKTLIRTEGGGYALRQD